MKESLGMLLKHTHPIWIQF